MKLDDPRTIRWLIRGSIVVLILLAGIDLVYHHHAHFPDQDIQADTWPFFFPLYGFVSCVAMVWVAKKVIGTVLMRPDDYYQTPADPTPAADDGHGTDGHGTDGHASTDHAADDHGPEAQGPAGGHP